MCVLWKTLRCFNHSEGPALYLLSDVLCLTFQSRGTTGESWKDGAEGRKNKGQALEKPSSRLVEEVESLLEHQGVAWTGPWAN